MKKIVSIIMLAIFVLTMSVTAFAVSENCVMTVDGVEYTDFAEGWTAGLRATADNENVVNIVLYADWKADENGNFGEGHGFKKGAIHITDDTKDLCFDLNGHTVDRGLFEWKEINTPIITSKIRENGEVLNIDDSCDRITIKNGTIRGGCNDSYPGGGGVYCEDANVSFENITFTSNYSKYGGGITLLESFGVFKDCTFELNTVSLYGGAIYFADSDGILINCSVNYNKCESKGGGIHSNSWADKLEIYDSEFVGNRAWGGAAIYTLCETIIKNTDFIYNAATSSGGAIHYEGTDLVEITDCEFTGNNAYEGGALWSYAETEIKSCNFENNLSTVDGCCRFSDTTLIEDCTFKNNVGNGDYPSAIFVGARSEVTLRDTEITGNTGKCAVRISTGNGKNLGELWIDGTVIIDDNFDGHKEVNVMLSEYGFLSASISMKKNFSKDSRIGLAMDADDMEDEKAITDIPDEWTNEELSEVFSFDAVFGNGMANNHYHLSRSGSNIIFKKGSPYDDANAIYDKEEAEEPVFVGDLDDNSGLPEDPSGTMIGPDGNEDESVTGTMMGDGSVTIIAAVIIVLVAAGLIIIVRKRK